MSEMLTPHVKGARAFTRPASVGMESLTVLTDFGIATCCFAAMLKILPLSPAPSWTWLFTFLAVLSLLWLLQKLLLGRTLGEMAWNLQPALRTTFASVSNLRFRLNQVQQLDSKILSIGIFLTLLPWLGAGFFFREHFTKHPLYQPVEQWSIAPFLPQNLDQEDFSMTAPTQGSEAWASLPYFYTLGTWPKTFLGKPIFYSIPYEAAPPHRFIGKIQARWQNPEIVLTMEGPKTPQTLTELGVNRDDLRACFLGRFVRHSLWSCIKFRDISLKRHFEEMNSILGSASNIQWTLRWFQVVNPLIPRDEQIEGFWILAKNATHTQARFVLVTGKGTHQTLILDTPNDSPTKPHGTYALKTLENAVGSLRINDSLIPGKIWVDQQLSTLKMPTPDAVKTESQFDKHLLAKLASAQALLVSKLSVDMKTFLTYNYLADISLLLLKYAARHQTTDLAATAKPLVLTAYRFGQDVMEADPKREAEKNGQWNLLQNTYLESKKY